MDLTVNSSFASSLNQQIATVYSVIPKSYMDLGVTHSIKPFEDRKSRFDGYLQLLGKSEIKASNSVEVVQLLNTLILLGERSYWGDNYPRKDRMYPLTLLGTKTVKNHPDISVLVSAKQAVIIGNNGSYQIWERDDHYNGDELKLTDKLLDKPGRDNKKLDLTA